MYFRIEPPFVRPISCFPPLAPAAWGWTLQWLASIISHSSSGSSIRMSSSFSQIPASRHRIKRRCVLLHPPRSGGKSRHGAPVRKIQKTALMNKRLSFATPPYTPSRPGRCDSSNAQTLSEISCLLCIGFMPTSFPVNMILSYFKSRDCSI